MSLADTIAVAQWGVLAAILVAVILYDLRQMRIPNSLTYLLFAVFVVSQFAIGGAPDLWLRVALAVCVFVLGFVGFMLRAIGGGDVKVLTALALFVSFAQLSAVTLIFSVSLIFGSLAVLAGRRFLANPESRWAFLRTRRLPMGLPIGAAGLLSLVVLLPLG